MPTISDWLNNRGFIGLETYFEGKVKLDYLNTTALANFIINPPIADSIFSDPDKWLSSLTFYPFDVNTGSFTDKYKLQIGGSETDIVCNHVNPLSFYTLGEFHIQPHFNNFADYDGYTKIRVWLPYYGYTEIPCNETMGKWLQVLLRVDYRTGGGCYYIAVSDNSIPHTGTPQIGMGVITETEYGNCRIIATCDCQIGTPISLGQSNTAQVYRNIITGAVKSVGNVAGGYAISRLGGSTTKGTEKWYTKKTKRNPKTGRQITTRTVEDEKEIDFQTSPYDTGYAVAEVFDSASTSLSYMHSAGQADKPNSPAVYIGTPETVHVVIYRPRLQPVSQDYGKLYGYPLGQTVELSTLTGYTEITNVHIEGEAFETATEQEKGMLMDAITSGIIL